MFVLFHDGQEVGKFGKYFDMVRYIHQNHPYSFSHALKYEGYSFKEVAE